jgi:RNA-binding protein YhbY
MLTSICEKLRAEPVNHIGKLLVIFRPNPKKTKITLP